jgi:uncharacterized membrane protein
MTVTNYDTSEDRTLPTVVYALYLLGLINGLTVIIGVIIAYANRDRAGPRAQSHYTFQIRTFWLAIVFWLIAGMMFAVGGILAVILIGIPFLMLGALILALTHIWFAVRSIVGLMHVSRDEAYPRPQTWLA